MSRLSLWGAVVVIGSADLSVSLSQSSPVLLTGTTAREWVSSDLFLLFGFSRLSKGASICCFEEDPGSRAASSVIAAT